MLLMDLLTSAFGGPSVVQSDFLFRISFMPALVWSTCFEREFLRVKIAGLLVFFGLTFLKVVLVCGVLRFAFWGPNFDSG